MGNPALTAKIEGAQSRYSRAVQRADSYREELVKIFGEERIFPESNRGMLASGYFKLALQDHASIVVLARQGFVTSATKLHRSLFEAMSDGLWTYLFANDVLVERLLNENDVHLPRSEEQIVTDLDGVFRAPDAEGESIFLDMRQRGWSGMCGFTHNGSLAINRILAGYDEDGPVPVLQTSTTLLLLFGNALRASILKAGCPKSRALLEKYFAESLW